MNVKVIDMGTKEQLKSGKSAFANAKHPPVYKDTVSIPPQGYVIIRIRTSNPGYWMIHCHLGKTFPVLYFFGSP